MARTRRSELLRLLRGWENNWDDRIAAAREENLKLFSTEHERPLWMEELPIRTMLREEVLTTYRMTTGDKFEAVRRFLSWNRDSGPTPDAPWMVTIRSERGVQIGTEHPAWLNYEYWLTAGAWCRIEMEHRGGRIGPVTGKQFVQSIVDEFLADGYDPPKRRWKIDGRLLKLSIYVED